MKKVGSLVLGFAILGLFGYLIFIIGQVLLTTFANLSTSLQTAFASAATLILVAGIGFFANKTLEQRKSIELAIRPRKVELYEEFVKFS